MTLIEVRHGDGRLAGRCDARCYEGKAARCRCVCGGRHHGIGAAEALARTRSWALRVAEAPGGVRVAGEALLPGRWRGLVQLRGAGPGGPERLAGQGAGGGAG